MDLRPFFPESNWRMRSVIKHAVINGLKIISTPSPLRPSLPEKISCNGKGRQRGILKTKFTIIESPKLKDYWCGGRIAALLHHISGVDWVL
jgi:hypothetical protein